MDEFIKEAFAELFAQDGLCVMAKGCGIKRLYSKFVELHLTQEVHTRKIVFCINAAGLEDVILDTLMSGGILPPKFPQIITNEVPIAERIQMYAQGGCFIITSRILIVDMLECKVDPSNICGFIVPNAEKITEYSIEAFILRVFREKNRTGFIKAFSEDPEHFQRGFGVLERTMKLLFVTKLFLWPRCHSSINKVLCSYQPTVEQFTLPITSNMKSIQSAILVAMNSCLTELKKAAPQLDLAEMTLESGLFGSFDRRIKTQLEQEWHKISQRTRQFVNDLTTLRNLLDHLMRYDSFSFYYFLLKLRVASSQQLSPSLWLTSEAANQIFQKARNRVYRILPIKKPCEAQNGSEDSGKFELHKLLNLTIRLLPVLECPPKWKLLRDLIAEIKNDIDKQAQLNHPNIMSGLRYLHHNRVVVIVKDELTLAQVKDILNHGDERLSDERFRWFVSQQAADIRSQIHQKNKPNRSGLKIPGRGGGGGGYKGNQHQHQQPHGHGTIGSITEKIDSETNDTVDYLGLGLGKADVLSLLDENKLLLLQEKFLKEQAQPQSTGETVAESLDISGALSALGKRPIEHMSEAAAYDDDDNEADQNDDSDHNITSSKTKPMLKVAQSKASSSSFSSSASASASCSGVAVGSSSCERTGSIVESQGLHLILITHRQAACMYDLMEDYCPSTVILYDPDIAVIRNIETYQANCSVAGDEGAGPVKVYFMMYEQSVEEHRYNGCLDREKKAFDGLAFANQNLVVALPDNQLDLNAAKLQDQELSGDSRGLSREYGGSTVKTMISLVNNNSSSNNNVRRSYKVVIDVREFRSSLPSVLHAQGFQLVARTITVGDYVLTPEICVERKGISDLFQSFASGRLFNQAESMTKYYQLPCLLIEFSADKSFSLQAAGDIPSDIQSSNICTRLSVLALAFPNLRILWSRSPHDTGALFKTIMTNHSEVDVAKAITCGSSDIASALGQGDAGNKAGAAELDESLQSEARLAAQEMLLALPGINANNYRNVMNAVESVAELSTMTEAQLTPLVGPSNARQLVAFFRHK